MNKDERYLQWAVQGAKYFSTCDKRQYMAILLDNYSHIVGVGYNGPPKGMTHCNDGGCPRLVENSPPNSSYDNCYAIHAEANCLLHSDYSLRRGGGTLYVNGIPCFACAKLIANSGVSKLVYLMEDRPWIDTKIFLIENRIELVEYTDGDLNLL